MLYRICTWWKNWRACHIKVFVWLRVHLDCGLWTSFKFKPFLYKYLLELTVFFLIMTGVFIFNTPRILRNESIVDMIQVIPDWWRLLSFVCSVLWNLFDRWLISLIHLWGFDYWHASYPILLLLIIQLNYRGLWGWIQICLDRSYLFLGLAHLTFHSHGHHLFLSVFF